VPDLILMDIVMPDMSGQDAIALMRQVPALAHVPIVAVSASATVEVREQVMSAGADGFLPKPVELGALLQRASALLQLRWTEDGHDPGHGADHDRPRGSTHEETAPPTPCNSQAR